MKIKDIKIENGIISIILDSNTAVSKVYIDNLYNDENKYSAKDEEHTYAISNFTQADTLITIDSKTLSPELDTSAFTVLIDGVLGFYYDDRELYYKEIDLLTAYCSTCLDKEQKERVVLFTLKQQLLQYAISNNLIEDQIAYYNDLARMLEIDVKHNAQALCSGKCKRIVKCSNGGCSLC